MQHLGSSRLVWLGTGGKRTAQLQKGGMLLAQDCWGLELLPGGSAQPPQTLAQTLAGGGVERKRLAGGVQQSIEGGDEGGHQEEEEGALLQVSLDFLVC